MNDITLPNKPRRHRWVTEALDNGHLELSVWPSPDEIENEKKQQRFLETIAKIGNDPRVVDIKTVPDEQRSIVYVFYLDGPA